jgi:hypothetical protein
MTKRQAVLVVIGSLFFCNMDAGASRGLQAQRVSPIGVSLSRNTAAVEIAPALSISVTRSTSDSTGVERAHHAVIGAVIGAVAGLAVGYHHGRVEDARCTGECGGPRISRLVDPPLFALLGGAIGAILGYVFPS